MKSIKNKKRNNKKTKKVNKSKKLYKNLKGGGNRNIPNTNEDNEIICLPGKFWGSKQINYTSYLTDNTKKEGINECNFFMEKLNDDNFQFWKNYNKYQDIATSRSGAKDSLGNKIEASAGVSSFKEVLNLYKNYETGEKNIINYDIWIAYITSRKHIKTNEFRQLTVDFSKIDTKNGKGMYKPYDDIEMTVTMCVDNISPITTHMGISKNFLYFGWYYDFKIHKNLSSYLHSFIAKVSNSIYPENKKLYMVTNPVVPMRNILDKSLTEYAKKDNIDLNKVIIIGNNRQRNKLKLGKQKHNSNNNSKDNQYNYKKEEYETYLTIKDNPSHKQDNAYIRPLLEEEELYISPLHNIDDENWSITYNGATIPFKKPKWFEHRDLLNWFSTTIIDIEHLGNVHFKDFKIDC